MLRFKYWVYLSTGLFVLGLGIGFIVSATMPASIVGFFSKELSAFEELTSSLAPFQASTAAFIFFKNVSVLLFSFMLSPILCLVPVLSLVFNGSLISFVSAIVARQESPHLVIMGLLPHGILEIPAIVIGEAAALSFGATTIIALFSRREDYQLLPNFKKNLKYLLLAFVLLIPAAIIETFVTPLLLQ